MTSDAEVRARLAGLPSASIPPEVREAIMARLAQESQEPQLADVVPLTPRHRRRLSGLLVAAAAAAFVMVLAVAGGGDPAPPVASAQPVVKAGAIYDPGPFAAQLRDRFLGAPAATKQTGTFADSPPEIVACTGSIDAFGEVLTLDAGVYGGQAAVVIVSTYPGDTEYEEVWVVNPQCGDADTDVIRHFLLDVDKSATRL
ncbi:MAG: hypothetical protein MUF33_11605 [Candidatus Nanopelagicales bacterium]|jgi:hypothetical protein|nr:hypothetical protein [Candidatus Nanopelagicales bacterium]MCU0295575.1 hypothetical protein [Candidatus Nanopelagicales bacterium]MCU0299148.1 hypothetical protein [Candidatus Nanopelagicales bacterium]